MQEALSQVAAPMILARGSSPASGALMAPRDEQEELGLLLAVPSVMSRLGEDRTVVFDRSMSEWLECFEKFGLEISIRVGVACLTEAGSNHTGSCAQYARNIAEMLQEVLESRVEGATEALQHELSRIEAQELFEQERYPDRLVRAIGVLIRAFLTSSASASIEAATLLATMDGDFRTAVCRGVGAWRSKHSAHSKGRISAQDTATRDESP
jgi:hypothetical protein